MSTSYLRNAEPRKSPYYPINKKINLTSFSKSDLMIATYEDYPLISEEGMS
jgi:hypothetical protein